MPSHPPQKTPKRPKYPKHPKPQDFKEPVAETSPRLQKVLATAGFGSRRQCEDLITAGRVEIDHHIITTLGVRVSPASQTIRVDGQTIGKTTKQVYIAVYKPRGVLCTHQDQKGRRRAVDLVPPQFGRVFPVGRLDMQSEGLLLLTNDGDLAMKLTHPRWGIRKTYRVQVSGLVERETLQQLTKGIYLAEGFVRVVSATIKRVVKNSTILDIVLEEGMNREIRRILARLGHKVMALIRVAIGPLKLGKMLPGEYRVLRSEEVAALKDTRPPEPPPRRRPQSGRPKNG